MTSALSRTTGKARRSAPGGWAGNAGATAWKCRSSLISSRSPASNARRSPANSLTGSSGSPCMCRASTASTISISTAATAPTRSPMATCSCRPSRNIRGTISNTPTPNAVRAVQDGRGGLQEISRSRLERRQAIEAHLMALPAYDQCIKASHVFNLLDARGVISVTERQATSCACANWQKPAAKPGCTPKRAGRVSAAA